MNDDRITSEISREMFEAIVSQLDDPERKVLTLVHAIVAGGSHIDPVDLLRCDGIETVLPFRVMAPSTVGIVLSSSADLAGTAVDIDAFHRRHSVVELAIRDFKEGAGMEHVPSGHNFSANSAWFQRDTAPPAASTG